MISLSLAKKLKHAGLVWQPQLHDFFAIPDTELDKQVFVVSDMMIDVQQLFGQKMITFNGAVEWSLDYILISDVVWMPTEGQLRQALEFSLLMENQPAVELVCLVDRYRCRIRYQAMSYEFKGENASDAYGRALLYILEQFDGQNPLIPGPIA